MKKVSVIIPVYNTDRYLKECLDSVLAQSLKELEILCIDDGSTDNSALILDSYAVKYKNITVIHKKNRGYGAAVNEGLKRAVGEYVGIVDSDDFISKKTYETLYKAAYLNNADIVKADFYEIKGIKGSYKKRRINVSKRCTSGLKKVYCIDDDDIFDYRGMNIWTGIYRNDLIKNNKICLNESPGAAFQDSGFWFQTLVYAKKIFFVNEAFYHYRKDNPNSSINDKEKVYDICGEYEFIRRFLKRSPERFKDYYKIFALQKFYAYMDSYRRIAECHKLSFLKRISEEFSEDIDIIEKNGYEINDRDLYPLEEMVRITDSPEIYYYESAIDRYDQVYASVNKDLNRLLDSREYKSSVKIRDIKNNMINIMKALRI